MREGGEGGEGGGREGRLYTCTLYMYTINSLRPTTVELSSDGASVSVSTVRKWQRNGNGTKPRTERS